MESRPTITAKNVEDFERLSKAVDGLPECVISSLENVSMGISDLIIGKFRETFQAKPRVVVPNYVSMITYYDNEVIFNTSKSKWVFKYPLRTPEIKVDVQLIETDKA